MLTFDPFREDVDGDVATFASPDRTLYYDGDPYDDGYDGAYAGDGYYEDQSYMTQASASVPRR